MTRAGRRALRLLLARSAAAGASLAVLVMAAAAFLEQALA